MREIRRHIVEGGPDTCRVLVEEGLGPGGAPHYYELSWTIPDGGGACYTVINFQKGGVVEVGGVNGVTHEALLAVVIDRLVHFQAGPYPSEMNAQALLACQVALNALQARTRERISRAVEGKSEV